MKVIRVAEREPKDLRCPYPAPFHEGVGPMQGAALGDRGGITQWGAHVDTLAPGGMASQRHWHENEDEFLMVLEGSALLVDDTGETRLSPGDCAAFPKGDGNGHHLKNDGDVPCAYLIVGGREADEVAHYPDIDMKLVRTGGKGGFFRRDGTPYPRRT